MNKVKMFFIAAALVLTTAGVFAGKAKFANISNLWLYNTSAGYIQATNSVSGTVLQHDAAVTTGATTTYNGTTYSLYTNIGGANYDAVYF